MALNAISTHVFMVAPYTCSPYSLRNRHHVRSARPLITTHSAHIFWRKRTYTTLSSDRWINSNTTYCRSPDRPSTLTIAWFAIQSTSSNNRDGMYIEWCNFAQHGEQTFRQLHPATTFDAPRSNSASHYAVNDYFGRWIWIDRLNKKEKEHDSYLG
eukprot:4935446-Amphidinium_carterae.1